MKTPKTALIIGASRGLGFAIVRQLLVREWSVTGTERSKSKSSLATLNRDFRDRLTIESVDITDSAAIDALKSRLASQKFDLLFVNAGVANDPTETVRTVSTDEFNRVMVTNALAPMRTVEALAHCVKPGGTIGIMSSGQGSVANNEKGGFEIYRASKAALNTLMRSFSARRGDEHALLLLAPGWIKTDMGSAKAPFTIEETIGDIVNTLTSQEGRTGVLYLDRFGKPVPW